jgi:hypothetical protein
MRTETVPRRVAIGCAIFMLFGPVADRTTWDRGSVTDAAGYNIVAFLSGVIAITALAVSLWMRPRVILPVLGALVTIAAFGLTIYVSGIYWLARTRGEVFLYGPSEFMRVTAKVDPASGPPFFATVALIGAIATLALAVGWLRQPRGA